MSCRFPSVFAILLSAASALGQEQWQEFPAPQTVSLPNGFQVVEEPRSTAKVIKSVPGPAEATVKGSFRNNSGEIFFLSDWSWDRRLRGQSYFWIYPNVVSRPAAPAEKVYPQIVELSFPNGFDVVDRPGSGASVKTTVPGPATANVKAHIDVGGVRYYMSDWSWDRAQQGKEANWMRPRGDMSPPTTPPLVAPNMTFDKIDQKIIFEHGFEAVGEVDPEAKVVSFQEDPIVVSTVAVAGIPGSFTSYYLTPENDRLRIQGKPFVWLRERVPRPRTDLLPRMRTLKEGAELTFDLKHYLDNPWRFSAHLYERDPERGLAAMREFGVAPYLPYMAPYYDDDEFPLEWMKEAAAFLNESNELGRAIARVRANIPRWETVRKLYQQHDLDEMMIGYMTARQDFEIRVLSVFEAERENFAEVENLLTPLLADWNPDADALNSSGPKINMLRQIARAQWKQGKTDLARVSTRRWLDLYARDIANDLLYPDYYSASERVMEFDNDFEKVGDYFDLLDAVTDPETAAEIVFGLKGLKIAVETSRQVRRAPSSDPRIATLTKELLSLEEADQRDTLAGKEPDPSRSQRLAEIHSELAMHRLRGAGADLAGQPDWIRISAEIERRRTAGDESWELDELVRQRDVLALKHLIEKGGFLIGTEDIRANLAPDETLIDFFRLPPTTVEGEGQYGAVVMSKIGNPVLIRIGSETEVDRAVKRYRDLMMGLGEFSTDSLETLAAKTDTVVAETYRTAFLPLTDVLEPGGRLVICPEGQLSFLPFDFLGEDASGLVQSKWEVSYVNSSRDLTRPTPAEAPGSRVALLVGDPNFEHASAGVSAADTESTIDETSRSLLADASRGVEFVPLPGTKEEVAALAPKLSQAGFDVTVLSGNEATESGFVKMVHSPTILHLATHGFFLNSLPVANQGTSPKSAMLLSGLALTGAQSTLESWSAGSIPSPGNDGILLASEVSRLDLSGTEAVVLSACETAVGKALSGEGVEGLRSGLTLAGAHNVLLTLWPVDDQATVDLMNSFYEKLLSGDSATHALATAKKELFRAIAQEKNTYLAHRFIGPFLLTRSGPAD